MPFIMNHTPETHRGRMSSIIPLLMGAGYTIGPVVMGAVVEHGSFRLSWSIAALVVLTSAVVMMFIRNYDLRLSGNLKFQEIDRKSAM